MKKLFYILFFSSIFMIFSQTSTMGNIGIEKLQGLISSEEFETALLASLKSEHDLYIFLKSVNAVIVGGKLLADTTLETYHKNSIALLLSCITIILAETPSTITTQKKIKYGQIDSVKLFYDNTKDYEFIAAVAPIVLTLIQSMKICYAEGKLKIKSLNFIELDDIESKIKYKIEENNDSKNNSENNDCAKDKCQLCFTPLKEINTDIINFCEFKSHIYCKNCLIYLFNNFQKSDAIKKCLTCHAQFIENDNLKLIYKKPMLTQKIKAATCQPVILLHTTIIAILLVQLYLINNFYNSI